MSNCHLKEWTGRVGQAKRWGRALGTERVQRTRRHSRHPRRGPRVLREQGCGAAGGERGEGGQREECGEGSTGRVCPVKEERTVNIVGAIEPFD